MDINLGQKVIDIITGNGLAAQQPKIQALEATLSAPEAREVQEFYDDFLTYFLDDEGKTAGVSMKEALSKVLAGVSSSILTEDVRQKVSTILSLPPDQQDAKLNELKKTTTDDQDVAINRLVTLYRNQPSVASNPSGALSQAFASLDGQPSSVGPKPMVAKFQKANAIADAARGFYSGLEYLTGIAPPNVFGVAAAVVPSLSGPLGMTNLLTYNGSDLSEEDYQFQNLTHRIGQGGQIFGNLVYSLTSRPTHADYDGLNGATYDENHNTSEEKMDLYASQVEPMVSSAAQADNGLSLVHNYRKSDTDPKTIKTSVALDALSQLSTSFALSYGGSDNSLEQATQGNEESSQQGSLVSTSVEDTTDTDYGSSQTLYNLFAGGAIDQTTQHNLLLSKIPYQVDLQANLSKLGDSGEKAGVAINTAMTALQIWAPWTKDKDPLIKNGHLTSRGVNAVGGLVGLAGATAGTFAANGENDYLDDFTLTTMRGVTAITNYYPKMTGPLVSQTALGFSGLEYGTDAPLVGVGTAAFYQLGGNVIHGVYEGLHDAAHPNDVRNKVNYGINSAIDVASLGGAVAYAVNKDNHLTAGGKATVIGLSTGAALGNQISYWAIRAKFKNDPQAAANYLKQTDGHLVGGKLQSGAFWGLDFSGTGFALTVKSGRG